jgi:hypothetical protein
VPQTFNVGARSLFVTATAWLFILLGALASVLALVQGASVISLLQSVQWPWLAKVLPWTMHAGVALSLSLLACAVGLLLRVEWARRLFIGLMILAFTVNLVGLGLQQVLLQALVDNTLSHTALPPQAADVVGGFVTATRTLAVAMTLGVCGALLWVIRRLMSASVRQEFA